MRPPQSQASYIFECTMAALYLILAYILLCTTIFSASIANPTVRYTLGGLLAVYGIFRIYRAIRKFIRRNKD